MLIATAREFLALRRAGRARLADSELERLDQLKQADRQPEDKWTDG